MFQHKWKTNLALMTGNPPVRGPLGIRKDQTLVFFSCNLSFLYLYKFGGLLQPSWDEANVRTQEKREPRALGSQDALVLKRSISSCL